MNFFKIVTLLIFTLLLSTHSFADSHSEQDIIEKAKEINKKIKQQQANKQANISSEISNEELLKGQDAAMVQLANFWVPRFMRERQQAAENQSLLAS